MNIENFFYSVINNTVPFEPLSSSSEDCIYDKLSELEILNNELIVIIEELLINAKEHGKAPVKVYIHKILDHIYFGISDHGPGIHNTIPNNINLLDTKNKNTSSIIRLSLEEGITGTGVKGRGIGLYMLSSLCKNNNAEIIVASNSGLVYQESDIFYTKENKSIDIKGTIICFKYRLTK